MGATRVEHLGTGGRIVTLAFLLWAPYYLYWRLGTLNADAALFSWLLWGAELFGFITAALHFFMVWRLTAPESRPAPEGLTVDVFIPTYNESMDIVRHTVAAAVRMDYPHTTWLLDDGNREEMRQLAEQYGCRYIARDGNEHAKAGNLNHALQQASGDFVAVFDADHVPAKNFLTRTLGFFEDERLAFVQTPQDFYNLDSFQHRKHRRVNSIWTEQSLFFRVIQRGKDYWNAAFFCGSCAVVRRQALDKIGGFATGTITEDLHTSIKMHKQGFRSLYYSESLAFGIAPDSIDQYLGQRLRWGQGAMQVWRREGFLFSSGLTLAQRLNYLASVGTYFDGWQKLVFYFAPIVVLLTGIMPINALGSEFLMYFIPYYLLCFWAFEEVGRGYGRSIYTEEYNMARYATFAKATLGLFWDNSVFAVTDKSHGRKTKAVMVLPQLLIVGGGLVAIAAGTLMWIRFEHLTPLAYWANVFWAGVNITMAAMVLRFVKRDRGHRQEYRFPVPLPAHLVLGNQDRISGVVADVSPSGISFICEKALWPGQKISGVVELTGCQAEFSGQIRYIKRMGVTSEVRSDGDQGHYEPRAGLYEYGLQIGWNSSEDQACMENMLFGTDLQWRLLGLREQIDTPLDGMRSLLGRPNGENGVSLKCLNQWVPVRFRDGENHHLGILFQNVRGRDGRLLTFNKLAPTNAFYSRAMGNGEADIEEADINNIREVTTENGSFYIADYRCHHLIIGETAIPETVYSN